MELLLFCGDGMVRDSGLGSPEFSECEECGFNVVCGQSWPKVGGRVQGSREQGKKDGEERLSVTISWAMTCGVRASVCPCGRSAALCGS